MFLSKQVIHTFNNTTIIKDETATITTATTNYCC